MRECQHGSLRRTDPLLAQASEIIVRLEAERDALLASLRSIADRCPLTLLEHNPCWLHYEAAHDAGAFARAAIAKVRR